MKLTLKKQDDFRGESMKARRCISCGYVILKSSNLDPYLCSDCEDMLINDESRYSPIEDMAQGVVKMLIWKKTNGYNELKNLLDSCFIEDPTDKMSEFTEK